MRYKNLNAAINDRVKELIFSPAATLLQMPVVDMGVKIPKTMTQRVIYTPKEDPTP